VAENPNLTLDQTFAHAQRRPDFSRVPLIQPGRSESAVLIGAGMSPANDRSGDMRCEAAIWLLRMSRRCCVSEVSKKNDGFVRVLPVSTWCSERPCFLNRPIVDHAAKVPEESKIADAALATNDLEAQKADLCELRKMSNLRNSERQLLYCYTHNPADQRRQKCGVYGFQLPAKNTAVIPRPTTITNERITDTGRFLASFAPT
jgi:hypothetical protein